MNPVSFLGLMGFLGFLGIATGETSYCGFFGFFGFAIWAPVRYDELFASYVKASATLAFFCMTALFSATVAAVVLFGLQSSALLMMVLVFVITLFVFVIRLLVFTFVESAEDAGA